MNLAEKHRPHSWNELVGLGWLQRQLSVIRDGGNSGPPQAPSGLGGHAYWLAGKSGSGKTTIARLIAAEVAENWAILEMDASDLTAEFLRKTAVEYRSRPLGGKGWAFIVNEAHGLTPTQIRKLLTILDSGNIPGYVVWVFTTTSVAQRDLFDDRVDAHPLLSRCEVFDELQINYGVAAEYVQKIARAEGLDGAPLEEYRALARECKGNIRMMLSRVQRGTMRR